MVWPEASSVVKPTGYNVFVRHGHGVNTKINRQNSGTQCRCIFGCKVLRFECVYNPLQSSGWLDNLQRHHTRRSRACTGQTQHLGRACVEMRPGNFMNGQNCLIFFHHTDRREQDRHGRAPAPPAEPVFSSSLRDSSRLPSPADLLCWQASGEKGKGFKSSCRVTLGNIFRKGDYRLLLIFIGRRFVQTLKETPWTVVQLIALFLATLLNLSIWAVHSIAKQLRWVVLVCDLLYFWTVSCTRRSVFPFCSLCRDTRYLSFIRASQDSTSSSWLSDNSISWQVQNKPMWGIL